jgi:hypothetical protein
MNAQPDLLQEVIRMAPVAGMHGKETVQSGAEGVDQLVSRRAVALLVRLH